jgi:formylglycine-generating enzyme required for sulfatase activity
MAPLGWGGEEEVHLPWEWEDLTGSEQIMLQGMGLGGGMPAATLRRPGRLWLALAICAGLALGTLGKAAFSGSEIPQDRPVIIHGEGRPAEAKDQLKSIQGGWRVTVATPYQFKTTFAHSEDIVHVTWNSQERACRTGEIMKEDGMEFVHVCPGTFLMGSTQDDPLADDDEKPTHKVILSEYWIGKLEVTSGQIGGRGDFPATNVSWFEADAFCRQHGWRLPTEAEWEYAARASKHTPLPFDEKKLADYAWFKGNSGLYPHPVGTKGPNSWGLHDMQGNVWEWVADRYGRYEGDAQTDPAGPATGSLRVVRGGGFFDSPRNLRSANREWLKPSGQDRFFGFRCARGASPTSP